MNSGLILPSEPNRIGKGVLFRWYRRWGEMFIILQVERNGYLNCLRNGRCGWSAMMADARIKTVSRKRNCNEKNSPHVCARPLHLPQLAWWAPLGRSSLCRVGKICYSDAFYCSLCSWSTCLKSQSKLGLVVTLPVTFSNLKVVLMNQLSVELERKTPRPPFPRGSLLAAALLLILQTNSTIAVKVQPCTRCKIFSAQSDTRTLCRSASFLNRNIARAFIKPRLIHVQRSS